jgi:hypothetical protein
MASPVFIPKKNNGYSHPDCYLSAWKGCHEKLSQEHYLSRAVLDKIERVNSTIDVAGLSWLPPGQLKSIGKSSLTAGILCANHNSALSGLDSEAAELVGAIYTIDQNYLGSHPKSLQFDIDGSHLERWVLKAMIGLVEGMQIRQATGGSYGYKKRCLDLICSKAERWPLHWGLYAQEPRGPVHHSSSFEFMPMAADDGLIRGIELRFNGFGMSFLMGKPDHAKSFGIHRPSALVLRKQGVASTIRFQWHSSKAGHPAVFDFSGTYSGTAASHDLPRAE